VLGLKNTTRWPAVFFAIVMFLLRIGLVLEVKPLSY
jgi:hypothetical protein